MPTKDEMIDKGFNLIPVNEINIEYDKNETIGYDFTVDDWYTFCTHDGVYVQDTLAIYIPISEKTIKEVKGKILSSNNLVNPANDSLVMTPGQDIVLGIYFLTNNKFKELTNKVVYKNTEITDSLKIVNECFPEDYPLINEPMDKKKLINILDDIRKKYDNDITVKVLNDIKKIGFKYSTLYGSTLSLDHFEIENLQELKDEIYSINNNNIDQLNKLNSDEIKDILKENFNYSYMIESGARGDWSQVNQIVFTRGFISNFKGQILPEPIKNSLLNGLTQEEFFNSTYGCRKGLMDVAINTGTSGYLSRKLNMSMVNLQINDDLNDCGTEDTLSLYVKNEYHAKMLMHRYYKNENNQLIKVDEDNYKDIIGNTIKLRSPIFCKEHKLCKTCYGDLYKIINSKFVGVISAQSLGETNTQMILRQFHTSLRKNTEVIDINGNSYKIKDVYNLIKEEKDFYTFSCSPEGKIVVSKVIDAHKDRFEKKMVKVTLDNDEVIECTLDHEWIMRDGSCKEAKDLIEDDSLMPIYINDNHKVKKVEFIELDNYEEFYDLSVDSEYENFALKAGIFIHNSGVANVGNTGETDSLLQQDIVADLSMTSKLLHSGAKDYNYDELVCKLFDTYNQSRSIHYIHFECLVSQMMWNGNKKWRLIKNRNEVEPEYQSIQSIPTMESWLLGLSFSNPKKHILEGILYYDNYKGIIDDILCGEKVY